MALSKALRASVSLVGVALIDGLGIATATGAVIARTVAPPPGSRRSLFFNGRSGDYRWTWSHGATGRVEVVAAGRSDSEVNESTADQQDSRDRQKSDYLLRRTLSSSSA